MLKSRSCVSSVYEISAIICVLENMTYVTLREKFLISNYYINSYIYYIYIYYINNIIYINSYIYCINNIILAATITKAIIIEL